MTVTADEVVVVISGAAILAGGVCALLSQTKWVKDRPGLARIINAAGLAAGRLALIVPPGATVAQVEAAIAAEAASVAAKCSDSVKASAATQADIASMIAGELGKLLPPGHVAPASGGAPALQPVNTGGGTHALTPPAAPAVQTGPVLNPIPVA